MHVSKTLFAQVMEFVPWKTFGRIIERHTGDAGVPTLGCADVFRILAFAQLTWRESLRDIEVCLAANQAKLFHAAKDYPEHRRRGLHHRRGRDHQVGRRAERAGSCAERAGRRALVATGYSSIIFPFREIEVPVFDVEAM